MSSFFLLVSGDSMLKRRGLSMCAFFELFFHPLLAVNILLKHVLNNGCSLCNERSHVVSVVVGIQRQTGGLSMCALFELFFHTFLFVNIWIWMLFVQPTF